MQMLTKLCERLFADIVRNVFFGVLKSCVHSNKFKKITEIM